MSISKACMDDGFNSELVRGARFDGIFEIPHIEKPKELILPEGFTPFTKRHRAPTSHEALCFFEFDGKFSELLIEPERFVETANSFAIFVPPDCSLYRDQPFATQICNVYRSRALGHYYQSHGANVYPLVRWGDERSYTDVMFPEPVAFAGTWLPVCSRCFWASQATACRFSPMLWRNAALVPPGPARTMR